MPAGYAPIYTPVHCMLFFLYFFFSWQHHGIVDVRAVPDRLQTPNPFLRKCHPLSFCYSVFV